MTAAEYHAIDDRSELSGKTDSSSYLSTSPLTTAVVIAASTAAVDHDDAKEFYLRDHISRLVHAFSMNESWEVSSWLFSESLTLLVVSLNQS